MNDRDDGEKDSGKSVQSAWLDDDDDDGSLTNNSFIVLIKFSFPLFFLLMDIKHIAGYIKNMDPSFFPPFIFRKLSSISYLCLYIHLDRNGYLMTARDL